jgi:hypothetical protein
MGWLRRIAAMPFPWPDKSSRHAAIAAARRQKERSQAGAKHADTLRLQIEALREQNHFASAIVDQIIRRRSEGG